MTSNASKIKLADLLSKPSYQAPRQELLGLIMSRIVKRKIIIIRFKIGSTAVGLASMLLYVGLNWQSIVINLSQSAIWQLPRLLISDFWVVSANWQDYAWYTVESLPLFSIVILTITMWLTLESIKFLGELSSVNKFKLKV